MSTTTPATSEQPTPQPARVEYQTARIHGATFSNATIREWVERHLEGRVLNATAGPTCLSHPNNGQIVRNDIDPDADTDVHLDVRELSQHFSEAFDTVVYDPPYSERQATVTYDCGFPGYQSDVTQELDAILRPGGKVLQFGYTTDGLATQSGYERAQVLLINTLGRRHDVLAVIDRKPDHGGDAGSAIPATDAEVVMNEHARTRNDTQPTPFRMHYTSLSDPVRLGDGLPAPVADWAQRYFQGRVLALYPGTNFDYHGTIIENHPEEPPDATYDPRGRGWWARSATAVTNLDAFEAGRFDTIVFTPPASAFFENTTIDGTTTGLDTAVKRQAHDLLADGGRLIQVGHTTTGMSSDYDYRRHAVGVFTTPSNDPDILGVVDENHSHSLSAFTQDPLPERAITCVRCQTAWDLSQGMNPAYDVTCPRCGAVTQEPCHTDPGAVREDPHPARIERVFTSLATASPCRHPDGHLFDRPRFT